MIANAEQGQKQAHQTVPKAEHLFQLYSQLPQFANDPCEWPLVQCYQRLLQRFQGYYNRQPLYFVKSSGCPLIFGECLQYVGFDYISCCTLQNIIVAAAIGAGEYLKVNNCQSAVFGERSLSINYRQWKLDQSGDEYANLIMRCLSAVANDSKLDQLPPLQMLIYADFVEEEFMYSKEALAYGLYTAAYVAIGKGRLLQCQKLHTAIGKINCIQPPLRICRQLLAGKQGQLTVHSSSDDRWIQVDTQYSFVLAHSLSPLPKKLIQGKRFNLRRCEVLIGIALLRNQLGFGTIKSLSELQQAAGCSLQELIVSVSQLIPSESITADKISQLTQLSLIDILRQIPYANNVIDSNTLFYPHEYFMLRYSRIQFFLKEALLIQNLNKKNLIEFLQESYANQRKLLEIGSEQIDALIDVGKEYSQAWRIIGNGWGGNVLFVCQKNKAAQLTNKLINQFYLAPENRILLSDDIEQYVCQMGLPASGLMILDPISQIWY